MSFCLKGKRETDLLPIESFLAPHGEKYQITFLSASIKYSIKHTSMCDRKVKNYLYTN